MDKKVLAGFIFLAVAFTGCGDDDDQPFQGAVREVKNVTKEHNLKGAWEGPCKDSEMLNASVKEAYHFKGQDVFRAQEFFLTDDCKEPVAARLTYKGKYELKDEVAAIKDAHDVDLHYTRVVLTTLTKEGADLLTAANFCGVDNWPVAQEVDLTDKSAQDNCPVDDMPKDRFDILKVEDKKLFFGRASDENDTSNLDARPMELFREEAFVESERSFD